MASVYSQYDDPAVLNQFLAIISASPLPVPPSNIDEPATDGPATTSSASTTTASPSPSLAEEADQSEENELSGEGAEGEMTAVTSQPSSLPTTALNSPAVGARAPPTTPASQGMALERASQLSAIAEVDRLLLPKPALDEESGLLGSKFANPWYVPPSTPVRIAARSAKNIASRAEIDDTNEFVSNAIEAAVEKAVQGEASEKTPEKANKYQAPSVTSDGITSTNTEPFPSYEDTVATLNSHHYDDRDYERGNPDARNWSTAWKATGSHGQTSHMAPLVDDHDDLTLHCDCGAALADDVTTARTRTVIMENLPSDADLTFVQALVTGGALEKIELLCGPKRGNSMAFMRFVDADACDRYAIKSAAGIPYVRFGKTASIRVTKAFDVDPMSVAMKCYLQCGATRVIQLFHVDDAVSTRALCQMAGDGVEQNKVESVSDVFRNDERVVKICFSSIIYAIEFRVKMTQEQNCSPVNIRFTDDPCDII